MAENNPNPNPAPNPNPNPNPNPAPDAWMTGFSDDDKGYVQTKGFKDPKTILDSYRNFEKLKGLPAERLLELPQSLTAPEMSAVWEKLGAPKEAKEYTFDIPKEISDEKMGEWAKETFHKLKVPRGMAEGFAKALVERQTARSKEEQANFEHKVLQEADALKKEWGQAYDQNQNIASQAALKFEVDKETLATFGRIMGPAKAMKFFHKLGQGLGEGIFVQGNGGNQNTITGEQARSEIKRLIVDTDFQRRLATKDHDSVERWNRLNVQAAGG